VAIFSDSNSAIALWNDPYNFFDIILVFVCAYGVSKKSRAAAIILFIYFMISKIFIGIETETGKLSSIGLGLFFYIFMEKQFKELFYFTR
jgi:hypothetical protein